MAFLLDRSESMNRSDRIEAVFDGLVPLLEATRRAGIPASDWSFADDVMRDPAREASLPSTPRATAFCSSGPTASHRPLQAHTRPWTRCAEGVACLGLGLGSDPAALGEISPGVLVKLGLRERPGWTGTLLRQALAV